MFSFDVEKSDRDRASLQNAAHTCDS